MFSNVGRPRREDRPGAGSGSKIRGSVQFVIVCDLEMEAPKGDREEALREFATMTCLPVVLHALSGTHAVRSRPQTKVTVRHMS